MRPTVIKIAAWGDYHIRSMCENILPCLLAPGNLSELVKVSQTYLIIYADRACPKEFAPLLQELDAIPGLQTAVQKIETTIDGFAPRQSRMILASTEHDSLGRARAFDADWFDFQSDTIIDSNFLISVKRHLERHNAVFGLPFRSRDVLFNEQTGGKRDFDANQLYQIALKAMHPVTLDYFVQEPPSHIPADPHQFFFTKSGRFVCRSWQPRPYGVYAKAVLDLGIPMTIDTYVLAAIDRRKVYVQEHVPTTDKNFFYLTALDGESIPSFGRFPVTVDTIVTAIKNFSGNNKDAVQAYVWALKKRCVYYTEGNMPVRSENEREVMSKIFKALGH